MKAIPTVVVLLLSTISALAGPIDRKSFALFLPNGWTENIQDDMYNPDAFVFFEKGETALFTVIVGQKSAGAMPEQMLKSQETSWRNRLTDLKFTDIHSWSRYKGSGVELEGTMQDVVRVRTRIFAFQNQQYTCLITESATVLDWPKLESDFEQLRKTFRLK